MLPPAHLASSAQNGGTELAVAVCPMEELCSMGHTVGELCCTVFLVTVLRKSKGKVNVDASENGEEKHGKQTTL